MALSQRVERRETVAVPPAASVAVAQGPAWQAFQLLHWGFVALPIVAGVDKFFQVLGPWHNYLAPVIPDLLGISPSTVMYAVGVVEILAGLVVAFKPSVGGWLVAAWLWGIIANLLLVPGFYDIALRDFGLSLGGIALARLATLYE